MRRLTPIALLLTLLLATACDGTVTPTPTVTPTETATHTPEPTATDTITPEPAATYTPSPTDTPTPTHTPVPTVTDTPTPVPTATDTATPKPTHTPGPSPTPSPWVLLSSANGQIPPPPQGGDGFPHQQTTALIVDVNRDGWNDFVIGGREGGMPVMNWWRRRAGGWDRLPISSLWRIKMEAGITAWDIDGDGDQDIVGGCDYQCPEVGWWENPCPNYDAGTMWDFHSIKNSGANKHHDLVVDDFDGDRAGEVVFWNQGAKALLLADIPPDSKVGPWPLTTIFTWASGDYEGLTSADIDGDGKMDVVGGGHWFEHLGGQDYLAHEIEATWPFPRSRVAVGDLVEGGRPEVLLLTCDMAAGELWMYEYAGGEWIGQRILEADLYYGHTVQITDFNGDGFLDIFTADMNLGCAKPDAKMWILYGDGAGHFEPAVIAVGYGHHDSQVGDLDGDGDMDILGKPYDCETPLVEVWLNGGTGSIVTPEPSATPGATDTPEPSVTPGPTDTPSGTIGEVTIGWPEWVRLYTLAPLTSTFTLSIEVRQGTAVVYSDVLTRAVNFPNPGEGIEDAFPLDTGQFSGLADVWAKGQYTWPENAEVYEVNELNELILAKQPIMAYPDYETAQDGRGYWWLGQVQGTQQAQATRVALRAALIVASVVVLAGAAYFFREIIRYWGKL